MSSFSQWWNSFRSRGIVKNIMWVCGSEKILVSDVIRSQVHYMNPPEWGLEYVDASDEKHVWATVSQYPLDHNPRVIVVQNAELLRNTDNIIDLIRNRTKNPNNYVWFVSNEDRSRRVGEGEEERLADFLEAFKGKGQVVECRPFTTATSKHAVTWAQSKVPMRVGVAQHLFLRSGWDLRLVRDILWKMGLYDKEPTIAAVNELMSERPGDTFADSLLALKKKDAYLSLAKMSEEEYPRVLGLLDSKLDLAGMVHDMLVNFQSPAAIARAAGTQNFLIPDILPVAKHYDAKRRIHIRKLLAHADEALRGGVNTAVLESVVAAW